MDNLFQKRMALLGGSISTAMKKKNDIAVDKLFSSDMSYKKGILYDRNHSTLQEIDCKFQVSSNYSLLKDQVEYWLQFRPDFYPEKQYNTGKYTESLGFYVEIPDNTGEMETWLIAGRNDRTQFVRYNILKCNWTFQWIYQGILHSCLGVLRYQRSYSGIKEGGLFTTVENQNAFWVPDTEKTQTIQYDTRFLLSHSQLRPLAFSVTKIEDTFPIGITKFTLKQDVFNPHTDNAELGIADYLKENIAPSPSPIPSETPYCNIKISGSTKKLIIGGSSKILTAFFYEPREIKAAPHVAWTYRLNKTLLEGEELSSYFIVSFPSSNSIKIQAKRSLDLIGSILEITASTMDGQIHSAVQLELIMR